MLIKTCFAQNVMQIVLLRFEFGLPLPLSLYIYICIYTYIYIYIYEYQPIGLLGRVFAHGLEDWGSIPGWIIPNTQQMVLDNSLLNIQHYKVCIKDKVEQSRESVVAIEKGAFRLPSTKFTNFTYIFFIVTIIVSYLIIVAFLCQFFIPNFNCYRKQIKKVPDIKNLNFLSHTFGLFLL